MFPLGRRSDPPIQNRSWPLSFYLALFAPTAAVTVGAPGDAEQLFAVGQGMIQHDEQFLQLDRDRHHGGQHHKESALPLAGGGLRMGQVVGKTDALAERPVDRPYTPRNLLATIYHALGIN